MSTRFPLVALVCAVLAVLAVGAPARGQTPWLGAGPGSAPSVDPPWAAVQPRRELRLDLAGELSPLENGSRLIEAVAALRPGDRLRVGGGIWLFGPRFVIDALGTAAAPIVVEAAPGERVVLTRDDQRQNVLDVGAGGPNAARFLALRGFEITGGSAGLRLHGCQQVWIDGNEIHHTGEAGLTANTRDTAHLHVTRNHVHHTGGYGEGMYLGANDGAVVMRDSVIAHNHVHDCAGWQGDGIELKQGSHGNWIVGNTVHDTAYPAILVYGTGGKPPNLVERNLCWGAAGNTLQVQGEAIVRNNLLIGGRIGFHTHDHQGATRDLSFVHNTIVTTGLGADLQSWGGRPGMVFANNAVYSGTGRAVAFGAGSAGVALAGNVVLGVVEGAVDGAVDGALGDAHSASRGGAGGDEGGASGDGSGGDADGAAGDGAGGDAGGASGDGAGGDANGASRNGAGGDASGERSGGATGAHADPVAGAASVSAAIGLPAGFTAGRGLIDLRGVTWERLLRDAAPAEASPLIDAGDRRFAVWDDFHGRERGAAVDAGAVERR